MPSIFVIAFLVLFTVPLVLCLNAMGRQIRADCEHGRPDRVAADAKLRRRILITVGIFVVVSLVLGHWMVGLTGFLTGIAFLLPYWLNPPVDITSNSRAD